ncbi:potassium-transporting ATPase subunit C [Natrinema pallidum]|uniref:Potassium-transporting ATPase KdpC subunit n=1 Tax=Natrinema pallidum DSM 3751 TaxID=1227495 RepID=L9YGI6_9EURY|nr:potassium-transporting ATPase subunit C [Natrinema pallidum]ELY72023.1 potassium-transporting ATPase subunit C [Natrinema pallidum DSM 3751]
MNRDDLTVSVRLLLVSFLLLGLVYQGSLMAIGATVFPHQASGSPVTDNGTVVGSEQIGQEFGPDDPEYFWSRPSSTDYDAMTSGSANLGPTNLALSDRVRATLENISRYETPDDEVPADLVAESGSAYDVHISPAAAEYQVPRVANQTGISEDRLYGMIDEATAEPWLGVYGHERVNVLELNRMVHDELED